MEVAVMDKSSGPVVQESIGSRCANGRQAEQGLEERTTKRACGVRGWMVDLKRAAASLRKLKRPSGSWLVATWTG